MSGTFCPYEWVPPQTHFPRDEHVAFEWLKEADAALSEFYSVVTEEFPLQCNEKEDIDAYMLDIKAPSFTEQMHGRLQQKAARASHLREEGGLELQTTSRKKSSHFPLVPRWLAMTPETEMELWMRWRLETRLATFRLAFDSDRSRFLRYHASTSQISNAHGLTTKMIQEGRHPQQQSVKMLGGQTTANADKNARLHVDGRSEEEDGDAMRQEVQGSAAIITFALFHPLRGFKMMEVECLDSNTFADLKDKLECDEERCIPRDKFKFSFLLTSGMFIIDDRQPDAPDYSGRIIEHLQRFAPERLLPEGCKRSMEALLLGNCELHYNTRGCYFHCGACEHRLVPIALRKYNRKFDCPYARAYPLVTFKPPTKTTELCQACVASSAEITVFNSLLCPVNPTSLCQQCYREFLCTDSGQDLRVADPFVFTTPGRGC